MAYTAIWFLTTIILILVCLSYEFVLSVNGISQSTEIQDSSSSSDSQVQDYSTIMECLNAMKSREKEVPFIYLDTKPMIRSFLRTLLPTRDCLVILTSTSKLKEESLTGEQNEALKRIYRDIVSNFATTDPGF